LMKMIGTTRVSAVLDVNPHKRLLSPSRELYSRRVPFLLFQQLPGNRYPFDFDGHLVAKADSSLRCSLPPATASVGKRLTPDTQLFFSCRYGNRYARRVSSHRSSRHGSEAASSDRLCASSFAPARRASIDATRQEPSGAIFSTINSSSSRSLPSDFVSVRHALRIAATGRPLLTRHCNFSPKTRPAPRQLMDVFVFGVRLDVQIETAARFPSSKYSAT
jgi:hypothetical protein